MPVPIPTTYSHTYNTYIETQNNNLPTYNVNNTISGTLICVLC